MKKRSRYTRPRYPVYILTAIVVFSVILILVSIQFFQLSMLLPSLISGEAYISEITITDQSDPLSHYFVLNHNSTTSIEEPNVLLTITIETTSETHSVESELHNPPSSVDGTNIMHSGFMRDQIIEPTNRYGGIKLQKTDQIQMVTVCVQSTENHIRNFEKCLTSFN